MKSGFYLKYIKNTEKKSLLRKRLLTAICAMAVAFAAMGTGYLKDFCERQREMINLISERELFVFNETTIGNPYDSHNMGINKEEVDRIYKIEGAEIVEPSLRVSSLPNGYNKFDVPRSTKTPDPQMIQLKNSRGLSETIDFSQDDEMTAVSIVTYPVEEYYDSRCSMLDASMTGGAYITDKFAGQLGITRGMLNGLEMNVDLWIPIGIIETGGFELLENDEKSYIKFYNNYTKKINVTIPIRGIVPLITLDEVYTNSDVYIFSEDLMKMIEENTDGTEAAEMEQYVKLWNESETDLEVSDEYDQNYYVREWTPSAYTIIVSDVDEVEQVKSELRSINPNFTVAQRYQDLEAAMQILQNNRNVMIYISFSVLAVVLLLVSLVYVGLIDKRKFEFAVLRANGMTKKEIRNVIYTEMLFEFVKIFIAGLLFAALIYLIARTWLGYMFQYDWITVLWLVVISFGATLFPTAISLLFVNKYEPEEVIRSGNIGKKPKK